MSGAVVVDASILVKLFSHEKEKFVAEARKLYSLIKLGKLQAFAPTFVLVEVLNVLAVVKNFDEDRVNEALQRLKRLGIVFADLNIAETEKLTRLHYRYGVTAYDALYLLLATNLGCKLVTEDKKLLKIKKHCVGLKSLKL